MIHYHGLPIYPDHVAAQVLGNAHVLVSFAHPQQIGLVAEICSSFVIDNGAFSAWKSGKPIVDWEPFVQFAIDAMRIPNCDWIIIPDVIDGDEKQNDELMDWFLNRWNCFRHDYRSACVPVWHMHESFSRFAKLVAMFPRVAVGSSGQFANPGSIDWWNRIVEALRFISIDGKVPAKLHGLRMLDPRIFTRLPLSSADSSTVARSIGIDKRWTGSYQPPTKAARGILMRQRIEHHQSGSEIPNIELSFQKDFFA